ncbi:MAG TPA: hypothetical protein VF660_08455 [Actinomycetota bacterium]|jgi:hypothetical protein
MAGTLRHALLSLVLLLGLFVISAPAAAQKTTRCTKETLLDGTGNLGNKDPRPEFKLEDVTVKKCLTVDKKTGEVEQTCTFNNKGGTPVKFLFCDMVELNSTFGNVLHTQSCSIGFDKTAEKWKCFPDNIRDGFQARPSFHFGCQVIDLAAGASTGPLKSGDKQSDDFKGKEAKDFWVSYADIFNLSKGDFDPADCGSCFGRNTGTNFGGGTGTVPRRKEASGFWIMSNVPITDPYAVWQETDGTRHDAEYYSFDTGLSVTSEFPVNCPDLSRTSPGTQPPLSYTQDLLLWDIFTMSDPPSVFTPVQLRTFLSPLPPGVTITASEPPPAIQGGSMDYGTLTISRPANGSVAEGAEVQWSIAYVDPADPSRELWEQDGHAVQDTVPPLVTSHSEVFDGSRALLVSIAARDVTTPVLASNLFYSVDSGATWSVVPLTPHHDPIDDPIDNTFDGSASLHVAQGQTVEFFYNVQDGTMNQTWLGPGRLPITNCETAPPLCSARLLPGVGVDVTIQDADSGLRAIAVTRQENAVVNVPPFALATQEPVLVTARKAVAGQTSRVELRITDVCGNVTVCDPVVLLLIRGSGQPVAQVVRGIAAAESRITVLNGRPGLRNLYVKVNGRIFLAANLADGEERTLDVSSAMRPGNANTIRLVPQGRPGSSAQVAIHDGAL